MKNTHKTVQIAIIFTILLVCLNHAQANDWPVYRGPDHNGISQETNWKVWRGDGPKVLWKNDVGTGFSAFAAAGNKAITMGNDGKTKHGNPSDTDTVFCFDVNSGDILWTHKYSCPLHAKYYIGGTLSTPTIDGNRVYSLSKEGELFCLNLADGKPVWSKHLGKDGYGIPTWHISGSPVVLGDRVYLNMGTAGVALDKKTGDYVWSNGKGVCGYTTPVPYEYQGKAALLISGEQNFYCVAQADGAILWKFEWKTQHSVNAADPIPFDDYVFVSSGYNRGCGLFKVAGGQPQNIWDNRSMRNHMNSSVLYQGYLYGFDENQLKCIKALDSAESWSEKSLGKGAVMMCSDGRLILSSDKSELVIAQAVTTGYQELAKASILSRKNCWTVPVLANGKIFIRNEVGEVACVDVSK